jgi:hypothetical protein
MEKTELQLKVKKHEVILQATLGTSPYILSLNGHVIVSILS